MTGISVVSITNGAGYDERRKLNYLLHAGRLNRSALLMRHIYPGHERPYQFAAGQCCGLLS